MNRKAKFDKRFPHQHFKGQLEMLNCYNIRLPLKMAIAIEDHADANGYGDINLHQKIRHFIWISLNENTPPTVEHVQR